MLGAGVAVGEVEAVVACGFAGLDLAVLSGLVVAVVQEVGVEAVLERAGVSESCGCCAEADILGQQAG